MSFAGGYHYRLAGDGFDADFFFFPVGDPTNPTPLKENFGWVNLTLSLGDTLDPPQAVVMDVYLSFDEAFAAGLDVVDGTVIGTLKLDPLASRVVGPLYQPSCGFVSQDLGNTIPGDCACRFPSVAIAVPLYVPLGSLLEEPVDLPPAPDAGVLP
jgi:hypothetical protein